LLVNLSSALSLLILMRYSDLLVNIRSIFNNVSPTDLTLKDTFKVENVAPGHCTGEPTFAALKQAFGNRYLYAGLGTSLPLGPSTSAGERRGEGPVLQQDDLTTYRRLARREDPFGVLQARNLRSNHSQF